jgi:predicted nucleotide-binding protein
MTLNTARNSLVEAGHRIIKEERLPNNTGTRLRLEGRTIVNVFDNGNYSCEGKNYEVIEALLDRGGAPEEPTTV